MAALTNAGPVPREEGMQSLNESALAGNGLDVSAYRCVVVAGRNRKNCTASIIPVASGCHPASAFNNATEALLFNRRQLSA
jgi:hypothetical protein